MSLAIRGKASDSKKRLPICLLSGERESVLTLQHGVITAITQARTLAGDRTSTATTDQSSKTKQQNG
jgi:hypothetical protein